MEEILKEDIPSIRQAIEAAIGSGKQFLTTNETAELLRVNYFTVYRLIRFSQIDAVRIRKTWRIPVPALIEYLEEHTPLNMEDM